MRAAEKFGISYSQKFDRTNKLIYWAVGLLFLTNRVSNFYSTWVTLLGTKTIGYFSESDLIFILFGNILYVESRSRNSKTGPRDLYLPLKFFTVVLISTKEQCNGCRRLLPMSEI